MRESAIKLSMEKAALQWRANNTKNRSFYLKDQPVLNSRVSNISIFGKAALKIHKRWPLKSVIHWVHIYDEMGAGMHWREEE